MPDSFLSNPVTPAIGMFWNKRDNVEVYHIIVETSTLFLNLENGYGNVVTDLVKTNSHLISTNFEFVQINSQWVFAKKQCVKNMALVLKKVAVIR